MNRVMGRADLVVVAGLVAITGYFAVLAVAVRSWPYERWMLLVLFPLLIAVGAAIIVGVTRHDTVPMRRLIIVAMVAKLASAFVRYFVIVDIYGGGDASRYYQRGAEIADTYHRGEITLNELFSFGRGTEFIHDLTGTVLAAIGPSQLGAFAVFSWIGFWGLFLFHRAALSGLPEGDHRRYALLVYFLPSLQFWPSSIGKESVMMLSLGLCALGAARLLERQRGALVPLAAGLGIAYLLRPHVAVVVLAALAVAVLFRRNRHQPTFGPTSRLLIIAILVLGLAAILGHVLDIYLPKSNSSGAEAVGELLDRAESGTASGGSEIERPSPTSLIDYPRAAFSVLFRPTPLEITNAGTLIAALEGMFVLLLAWTSRTRLKNIPRIALQRPYILFAIAYTALFTFAWSSFANLGALARQRVQLWPFVLLLLALPTTIPTSVRPGRARTQGHPDPHRANGSQPAGELRPMR